MSIERSLAVAVTAGGFIVLAVALGWWWITYSNVIGYAYIDLREAGTCLVGDSDICRLARALCRGVHPTAFAAYRSAIFWLGLILALSGVLALEWRRS